MATDTTQTMSMFTPRICTWEDLDYTSAEKLLNTKTTNGAVYNYIGSLLFRILGQESGERRIKITKDLFYNLVLFCRKNKFTPEQLTALFTIFKTLHLLCISTPYNNIDECYQLVKDFMVKHSVFRPPYSISLFTLHQVKLITDYILETYFKHFKMYKFAFTKRVLLDLCITYEKDGKDEKEEKMESDTGAISQEANETEGKEESVEQDKGEVEAETIEDNVTVEVELSDDLKQLKDLISQTLTERLNELKVTVEKELSISDKRLTDRLSALETEIDGGKVGKKKK